MLQNAQFSLPKTSNKKLKIMNLLKTILCNKIPVNMLKKQKLQTNKNSAKTKIFSSLKLEVIITPLHNKYLKFKKGLLFLIINNIYTS